MDTLKFVIVGHVDHGKSTLIGRLLYDTNSLPEGKLEEVKAICKSLGRELEFAFIMDNFQEEREQNITIDTTQTFFKTNKRNYVIIDAPGHVEFIKNMITGASQAEAAILIVDAKEGVQEQTRRHAYILGLLGLKQVIVVMNKMDLVEFSENKYNEVCLELKKFLTSINITPTYVIPISAHHGDNVANASNRMPWYSGPTVLSALDTFKTSPSLTDMPLRYPIQDVYKISDKRILVGRIESGNLKEGQDVIFFPAGTSTKIKSIEIFGGSKRTAEAGESIGVTTAHPLFLERGQIACTTKDAPKTCLAFLANVFWMDKKGLNNADKLQLRCATQEIGCQITINKRINSSTLETLDNSTNSLENNDVGQVVVKTPKPIAVDLFNNIPEMGRFVLVRDNDVIAGGIVAGF